MSLVLWIVVCIIDLAGYINIGVAYGRLMDKICHKTYPNTLFKKVATVRGFFADREWSERPIYTKKGEAFGAILWPIVLIIQLGGWLLIGIYYLCWLLFAGGIVKVFWQIR